MVLFALVSCLVTGVGLYACYKVVQLFGVDDGTAFAIAFVILLCFAFIWLSYGVFFPSEMNEYYLRAEVERMIQTLKEKKQNGA